MTFTGAGIMLAAIVAAAGAQTVGGPQFEAASVKPVSSGHVSMRGGPGTADPERITYESVDLRQLLVKAYRVESDQISGPGWIDSEKYTVIAKVAPGTTDEHFRTMLQSLLAERFRMTLHHEAKEYSVYELTVAKGGAKLTRAAAADPNDPRPAAPEPGTIAPMSQTLDKEGCPVLRPGVQAGTGRFGPGTSCQRFVEMSMPELAKTVEQFVAMSDGTFGARDMAHVVDQTGIAGEFDITLKFHLAMRFPGQVAAPGEASDPDGTDGPSLFTALEQQLGLKLEKKKMSLDLIVVDKADRVPTEN